MKLLLTNPYILLVAIMWFSGAVACFGSKDAGPMAYAFIGTFCVWLVWNNRT
jgi:hypothetical protein